MNHCIGTPETTAGAMLLVRALDRPGSVDDLTAQYEPDLVNATIETAYGWVGAAFERRPVEQIGVRVGAAAVAGEAAISGPEATAVLHLDTLTIPKSQALASPADLAKSVREEFPNPHDRFLGRKPESFNREESRVVVSALRRLARVSGEQPDVQLEVNQYLSRNAPWALQRMMARNALRKMDSARNLVQYTDAGTTRSRNGPHWFAALAGRARNQRRYLRHS